MQYYLFQPVSLTINLRRLTGRRGLVELAGRCLVGRSITVEKGKGKAAVGTASFLARRERKEQQETPEIDSAACERCFRLLIYQNSCAGRGERLNTRSQTAVKQDKREVKAKVKMLVNCLLTL